MNISVGENSRNKKNPIWVYSSPTQVGSEQKVCFTVEAELLNYLEKSEKDTVTEKFEKLNKKFSSLIFFRILQSNFDYWTHNFFSMQS